MNRTETSQGGTEQEVAGKEAVVAVGAEAVETATGGTEVGPKAEKTADVAEPAKKHTCRYDLMGGTPCSFGVDDPGQVVEFTRDDGSKVKIPAMSVVFQRNGQPVWVTQGEKGQVLVWICHAHVGDVRQALATQFRKEGATTEEAKIHSAKPFMGLGRFFEQQRRKREEEQRVRQEREKQRVTASKVASFLLGSKSAPQSTSSPQPVASASMPFDSSAVPPPDKSAGRRERGSKRQQGDRPHAGHREERKRPRVVRVEVQPKAVEPQPAADSGGEDEKGGKSATPVVSGHNSAPEPATASFAAMVKGKDGKPIIFNL